MKAIARRLRRLEDQFGPEDEKQRVLLVMHKAGCRLALDWDRCFHILDECGFLPGHGWSVVYLGHIPDGLNAGELEQYLREHGAELFGGRATDPRVETL